MNIWIKSLTAGAIIAIAAFFVSGKLNEKNALKKYSIEYTLEAEPVPGSALPFSLSEIAGILEKRLQAGAYKFKIEKTDTTKINVSLFNLKDSSFPTSILTTNNRVQFRELYTIDEVLKMLQAAIGTGGETDPLPERKDSIHGKTNGLAENLEHPAEEEKNNASSLIEFSQPYKTETGAISYQSEIGRVKLKDTAATLALFHNEKLRLITPADLQIRFGEADKKIRKNKKPGDELLALYFLKTRGSPDTALLENKDILTASTDFDQFGKVEIRLQFNESGSRKWAIMTSENIGHPIAIVVNNTVISAPHVMSAIPDGYSSITGAYSASEAEELSLSLKSPLLPAKLSIISCQKIQDKTPKQTGKELIKALVIFILMSLLSFFILNTLKSTR